MSLFNLCRMRNLLNTLSFFILILLVFTSCSEDEVSLKSEENLRNNSIPSFIEEYPSSGRTTNLINIGTYVVSPLDNSGRIILDADGSTEVTWSVNIRRSNANEDINQQISLNNGFPSSEVYSPTIFIKTLDMGGSLEKTFTETTTVNGSPSEISIVTRNFLQTPAQDSEIRSYSTIVPTLDVGEIVGVSSLCRYRDLDGDIIAGNFSRWGVKYIQGANYKWTIPSNFRARTTLEAPSASNLSTGPKNNAPASFTATISVTVSKPGLILSQNQRP